MASVLEEILEVSISVEYACAAVYETFAKQFSDRRELALFWGLYAETERYHAATLRLHKDAFSDDSIDRAGISTQMDEQRAFLAQLEAWRDKYAQAAPTIDESFAIAQRMENDTAEYYGRTQFFKLHPGFQALFKSMTEDDIAHRDVLSEARTRFSNLPPDAIEPPETDEE